MSLWGNNDNLTSSGILDTGSEIIFEAKGSKNENIILT